MMKEQKKRADELTKKIETVKGHLGQLVSMAAALERNNNEGLGLKFETSRAWHYIGSKDLGITFVALVTASRQRELDALEAEFAAL